MAQSRTLKRSRYVDERMEIRRRAGGGRFARRWKRVGESGQSKLNGYVSVLGAKEKAQEP